MIMDMLAYGGFSCTHITQEQYEATAILDGPAHRYQRLPVVH
jgi:hypothetical protein